MLKMYGITKVYRAIDIQTTALNNINLKGDVGSKTTYVVSNDTGDLMGYSL